MVVNAPCVVCGAPDAAPLPVPLAGGMLYYCHACALANVVPYIVVIGVIHSMRQLLGRDRLHMLKDFGPVHAVTLRNTCKRYGLTWEQMQARYHYAIESGDYSAPQLAHANANAHAIAHASDNA